MSNSSANATFVVNIQAKIDAAQKEIGQLKKDLNNLADDSDIKRKLQRIYTSMAENIAKITRLASGDAIDEKALTEITNSFKKIEKSADDAYAKMSGLSDKDILFNTKELEQKRRELFNVEQAIKRIDDKTAHVGKDLSAGLQETIKNVLSLSNLDGLTFNNFTNEFSKAINSVSADLDKLEEKIERIQEQRRTVIPEKNSYVHKSGALTEEALHKIDQVNEAATSRQIKVNEGMLPENFPGRAAIYKRLKTEATDGLSVQSIFEEESKKNFDKESKENSHKLREIVTKKAELRKLLKDVEHFRGDNLSEAGRGLNQRIGYLVGKDVPVTKDKLLSAINRKIGDFSAKEVPLRQRAFSLSKAWQARPRTAEDFQKNTTEETFFNRTQFNEDVAKMFPNATKEVKEALIRQADESVTAFKRRVNERLQKFVAELNRKEDKIVEEQVAKTEKKEATEAAQKAFNKEMAENKSKQETKKTQIEEDIKKGEKERQEKADEAAEKGQAHSENVRRAAEEGGELAKEEEKQRTEIDNQTKNLEKLATRWMSLWAVLGLAKRAFREIVQHMRTLDKVMTEIAVVTDMTQKDLWAQVETYSALAKEYGVKTEGVYEVSMLFYQQGLATNEVMAATTETLKMAKIANLDYATSTNYMTNAVRGFKMSMAESQTVVDVYSHLAAISASDTKELAEAMSRTASSMESVGSSFQNTSAMIATMVSVTRESASSIGSALKSIASRYGEMKKNPNDLIDVEGEAASFNKVDAALKSVGISLRDAQGQIRDFDDVILELSGSWDKIDRNTQRYIATIMAGNRQQSRFLALVGNADMFHYLSEEAYNAEDAATLQTLKTMDSLESKIQQLKVTYQEFYTTIGAENAYKALIQYGINFVQSLNDMGKLFDKLPVMAIASIAEILNLFHKLVKVFAPMLVTSFRKLVNQSNPEFVNLGREIAKKISLGIRQGFKSESAQNSAAMQGSVSGTGSTGEAIGINKKALMASIASSLGTVVSMVGMGMGTEGHINGIDNIGQIVGGAGGLIGGGIAAFMNPANVFAWLQGAKGLITLLDGLFESSEERLKRLERESTELNNEALKQKDEKKTLDSAIEKYELLSEKRYDSAEAEEEFNAAAAEMAENFPILIDGFDTAGNAIIDLEKAEENLAELRKKTAQATWEAADKERQLKEAEYEEAKAEREELEQAFLGDSFNFYGYNFFKKKSESNSYSLKDSDFPLSEEMSGLSPAEYEFFIKLRPLFYNATKNDSGEVPFKKEEEGFSFEGMTFSLSEENSKITEARLAEEQAKQALLAGNKGALRAFLWNEYDSDLAELPYEIANLFVESVIKGTSIEEDFDFEEWKNDSAAAEKLKAYQELKISEENEEALIQIISEKDSLSKKDYSDELAGKDLSGQALEDLIEERDAEAKIEYDRLVNNLKKHNGEIVVPSELAFLPEKALNLINQSLAYINDKAEEQFLALWNYEKIQDILSQGNYTSLADIVKTRNKILERVGNDAAEIEEMDSFIDAYEINIETETKAFSEEVVKTVNLVEDLLGKATKGMNIEDATKIADRLGTSIFDEETFRQEGSKFFLKDTSKLQSILATDFNSYVSELIEKIDTKLEYPSNLGDNDIADLENQREFLENYKIKLNEFLTNSFLIQNNQLGDFIDSIGEDLTETDIISKALEGEAALSAYLALNNVSTEYAKIIIDSLGNVQKQVIDYIIENKGKSGLNIGFLTKDTVFKDIIAYTNTADFLTAMGYTGEDWNKYYKEIESSKVKDTDKAITDIISSADKVSLSLIESLANSFGTTIDKVLQYFNDLGNGEYSVKDINALVEKGGLEARDALQKYFSSIISSFTNGIKGSLSLTDAESLGRRLNLDLDFSQTEEGLKLTHDSAVEVFTQLEQINALAARKVLDDWVKSSEELNSEYGSIEKTAGRIKDLEEQINNKTDKEKLKILKQQLHVAKEIYKIQSTDPKSFDFMGRKLSDPMQGPIEYWNSFGNAFTSINEAKKSGYMEVDDFYNMITHMSTMMESAGKEFSINGMNAAQLIQKGFSSLANVDGKGVKINLKGLGLDLKSGADSFTSLMDESIKIMAQDQIDMLDAAIAFLEGIAALEDLDINSNNKLDFNEIFNVKDRHGKEFYEFNGKFEGIRQQVLSTLKELGLTEDSLKTLYYEGISLYDYYTLDAETLIKTFGSAEALVAALNELSQLNFGEFNPNNPLEIFGSLPGFYRLEIDEDKTSISFNGVEYTKDELNTILGKDVAENLLSGEEVQAETVSTLSLSNQGVEIKTENGKTEYLYNGKSYDTPEAVSEAINQANVQQFSADADVEVAPANLVIQVNEETELEAEPVDKIKVRAATIEVESSNIKIKQDDNESEKINIGTVETQTDEVKIDDSKASYTLKESSEEETAAKPRQLSAPIASLAGEADSISITSNNFVSGQVNPVTVKYGNAKGEVTGSISVTNLGSYKDVTPNQTISFDSMDGEANSLNVTANTYQLQFKNDKGEVTETINVEGEATLATILQGDYFDEEGHFKKEELELDLKLNLLFPDNVELPPVSNSNSTKAPTDEDSGNYRIQAYGRDPDNENEYIELKPITTQYDTLQQAVQVIENFINKNNYPKAYAPTIDRNVNGEWVPVTSTPYPLGEKQDGQWIKKPADGVIRAVQRDALEYVESNIESLKENGEAFGAATQTIADELKEVEREVNEIQIKPHVKGTVDVVVDFNTKINSPGRIANERKTNKVAYAKGTQTLMGELGPELYVSNGQYFIAGQNGAEFVNLADDAIVFNHLDTRRLLSSGSGGRGKPVTNTKKALAFAKGSGPAKASARETLDQLKAIRELWSSILEASAKDLGHKAGSGGGGGGGKDQKAVTGDLERWYNLLRQIAKYEQKITYEQAKRKNMQSGYNHVDSLEKELDILKKQEKAYRELAKLQGEWYEIRRKELLKTDFSKIFTYDKDGLMQYVEGENRGLDVLAKLNQKDYTGKPTGTGANAKAQIAYLKNVVGFDINKFLSTKDDGTKVKTDEERMELFWSKVDGWKDELDGLYDEFHGHLVDVENNLSAQTEILKQYTENQLSVEQKLKEAIEEREQEKIDKLTEIKEATEEAANKYTEGLNNALQKEQDLYADNSSQNELEKLQRKLAILERSGGSATEISNLKNQIDEQMKEDYFNEQQKQIQAIEEASAAQLEKMQDQIDIATETLEYQKANGLLWDEVYSMMKTWSPAQMLEFIEKYLKSFREESALQNKENSDAILKELEIWAAKRDKDARDKSWELYLAAAKDVYSEKVLSENSNKAQEAYNEAFKNGGDSAGKAAADEVFKTAQDKENENAGKPVEPKPVTADQKGSLKGGQMNIRDKPSGNKIGIVKDGKSFTAVGYDAGSGWLKVVDAESTNGKVSGWMKYTRYQKYYHGIDVNKLPQFKNGGEVDYTGLAMVHGSKRKPEMMLSAEDTALLKSSLFSSGENSLTSLVREIRELSAEMRHTAQVSNSNSVQIGNIDISIESGVIANDYDANRAGEEIMNKILAISRKSGSQTLSRR